RGDLRGADGPRHDLPDPADGMAGAVRPGRQPAGAPRDAADGYGRRLRADPDHPPPERGHQQLEARQPPLPQHLAEAVPDLEDTRNGGKGEVSDRGRRGRGDGVERMTEPRTRLRPDEAEAV